MGDTDHSGSLEQVKAWGGNEVELNTARVREGRSESKMRKEGEVEVEMRTGPVARVRRSSRPREIYIESARLRTS